MPSRTYANGSAARGTCDRRRGAEPAADPGQLPVPTAADRCHGGHGLSAEARPVQVDDDDTRLAVMGRAALRARVEVGRRPVDLITCHLESTLLAFPLGSHGRSCFDTGDEGERARVAVRA